MCSLMIVLRQMNISTFEGSIIKMNKWFVLIRALKTINLQIVSLYKLKCTDFQTAFLNHLNTFIFTVIAIVTKVWYLTNECLNVLPFLFQY